MTHRLIARPPFSSNVLLLVAVLAAGCGKAPAQGQTVCDPPCPDGTRCAAEGCVPDSPLPDLAAPTHDLTGGCEPACVAPAPYCAGGVCQACLADEHCPPGEVCLKSGGGARCVPGCTGDTRCASGDGGAPSVHCCSSACVDTASDPGNCGGCGLGCSVPHASAQCSDGKCSAGACEQGWGDCNLAPGDGCEANLRIDTGNCGACGAVCDVPNGRAGCSDACFIAACHFGHGDCNADPKDGCETPILSDARNCGGCALACPVIAHGRATCGAGTCRPSCDNGYGDCNGILQDGCEAAFATDAQNCGACGTACGQGLVCINGGCTCPKCSFPNARSACVNLVCQLSECLAGFADCNHDPKDGCEVSVDLDSNNCGACGNTCPMGTPSCSQGECVLFQGLVQIADRGLDKRVVLANGGGMLSPNLDALDGSAHVIMTQSAAVQVGGNLATGIPDSGLFPANNDHPDIQLAANNSNDGSFSARILVKQGAFNLPVPQRTYKQLQLYAASTEGVSNLNIALNYADRTTDSLQVSILDWYTHPPGVGQFYIVDKLDRYSITNHAYEAAHTPGLVGFNLNPNPAKQVVSIDVTLTQGGWLIFLGATGQ